MKKIFINTVHGKTKYGLPCLSWWNISPISLIVILCFSDYDYVDPLGDSRKVSCPTVQEDLPNVKGRYEKISLFEGNSLSFVYIDIALRLDSIFGCFITCQYEFPICIYAVLSSFDINCFFLDYDVHDNHIYEYLPSS